MFPLRPVRKGILLLLMSALLPLLRGTPFLTGSTAPLGLAKGTWPLTAGLVTIPVTAPAEGFDPPRMSCMKNDNVWWRSVLVTVVLVAAAGAVATEVTLDTGASTRSDASGATG